VRTSYPTYKQGKIIEDETEIINRWAKHFEELFNKNYVNIERLSENNKYLTARPWIEFPTLQEVEDAVLKLKIIRLQVKTLTAELINHGGQILLRRIHKFIYLIWDQGSGV
jgi:hypothetical protein